jgi:alanyl-tRNA synthetase
LQVSKNEERILKEIDREEARFSATIAAGQNQLDRVLSRAEARAESSGGAGIVTGEDAFSMYDTYGFPLELTQEIAAERGLTVDEAAFGVAMEEQRKRSKVCLSSSVRLVARRLCTAAGSSHCTHSTGYHLQLAVLLCAR